MESQPQNPEADFLWKVSLKILNSGIILKTFTHVIVGFNMTLLRLVYESNIRCMVGIPIQCPLNGHLRAF